ncbi:MAG: zinc ribbon domain-containing protein [Candidatus Neomarinimicrobiota bacterium]|nr:zinc ribbon domain-containing protein [Candidatus Neomarinimicrobiota bacterium]
MPTYDYFCKKCQNTFEYFQSMSDSALEKCPKCNNKVRRLISGGSGLIFKGSGFYLTDYAQKKENKRTSKNKKKTDKKKPKEKNKKK